jgi:hypothetical protein
MNLIDQQCYTMDNIELLYQNQDPGTWTDYQILKLTEPINCHIKNITTICTTVWYELCIKNTASSDKAPTLNHGTNPNKGKLSGHASQHK